MVVPLDSVPGASACPIGEDTRRRPPSTSDLGAQTVRASTVGGHGVATGKTCHHIGHFSHTSPAGTPPTHRPRPSESPRPAPPMHQTRAALKAKVRKSSYPHTLPLVICALAGRPFRAENEVWLPADVVTPWSLEGGRWSGTGGWVFAP